MPGSPPDDLLTQFLRHRDAPCPVCKYNLRNLTSGRCPECGHEVNLMVGVTEPFLAAWIGAAMVLFASAGLGIVCMIEVLARGRHLGSAQSVATGAFMLAVPLSLVLIERRRSFLRLGRSHQWEIVAALAIFYGLAFGVLLLEIGG